MKQQLDTLVWIGAGSAELPADLISLAKRSILVEARELACNALKERFVGNSQVQIIQQCISSAGDKLNWYQYNLAEFSATAEASGLKALFPGLKLQQRTEQDSMALIPFLTNLALGEGKKALLLDCPAQNADFLKEVVVQNSIQFEHLYITVSEQALYEGMQTQQQLIAELQQHGYQQEATDSSDPDLPVLHFNLNPLWQAFQAEKTQNKSIKKQLEQANKVNQELNHRLNQADLAYTELGKELEMYKNAINVKQAELSEAQKVNQISSNLLLKMNMYLAKLNDFSRGKE